MTDWKKHWNTKTTVKEFWHPMSNEGSYDEGYSEGYECGRQEAYDQGWNDALSEVKSELWSLEK